MAVGFLTISILSMKDFLIAFGGHRYYVGFHFLTIFSNTNVILG